MLRPEPGREGEGSVVLPIVEGQRLIQALKQELAAGYAKSDFCVCIYVCVCVGLLYPNTPINQLIDQARD